jgi:ribonuclease P protein component
VSNNRFPKSEKLCSHKIIQELFTQRKDDKSSSTFLFPYKISVILPKQTENEILNDNTTTKLVVAVKYPQVVISVSKKNFKRAVDRNRIKRQIREIYRLSKSTLFDNLPSHKIPAYLGITFVAKEHQEYSFMNKRFIKVANMLL